MDYRKPVTFGDNWSPTRYQVLPYFAHERRHILPGMRVLDLGCANGWNMSRFTQYGVTAPIGLEPNQTTVKHALTHGPAIVGDGLKLPFAANTFDVIYEQHVLHHIGDVQTAIDEVRRCLKPGGLFFLIETVENNPIIRWGRRLYPKWMGDEINAPFRFNELRTQLEHSGFSVTHAEPYSVLFWLWETMPDKFPKMERFTPWVVPFEKRLIRLFPKHAAHCFFVVKKSAQ